MTFDLGAEIKRVTEIQLNAEKSGLSPDEVALIPESAFKDAELVLERDAEIVAGDLKLCGILRAYGRYERGFRGSRETPEEPGGYDVHLVTFSHKDLEVDVTGTLTDSDMTSIEQAATEDSDE
jgi:hypothetical protein